jgi:DNA-binding transcriptional ArsR family regulator
LRRFGGIGIDWRGFIHNRWVVDSLTVTFAALTDPTRRSILARLAAGPATVGDLAGPFRMSQQAVSKHLAYLLRARLIEKHRRGRSHFCRLRAAPIRQVSVWAAQYRIQWEQKFDRLDAFLKELQKEKKP